MSDKHCEMSCKFKCFFSWAIVIIALIFGILSFTQIENEGLIALLSGIVRFFETITLFLLSGALFKYLVWGGKDQ